LDCRDGEEYNFAYVLPQPPNTPEDDALLVIPTSLQLVWIKSLAFFCAATEASSRDIIGDYANTPIGNLPAQKFKIYAIGNKAMILSATSGTHPHYCTKVYVDNFMSLVIRYSVQHLQHMTRTTIMGIYNIFLAEMLDKNNAISLKKLLRGNGD
jgi:hypothetical protein